VVDDVRTDKGPAPVHARIIHPYSHSLSNDEKSSRPEGMCVASLDTWVAYAPQVERAILPEPEDVLKAIVEVKQY